MGVAVFCTRHRRPDPSSDASTLQDRPTRVPDLERIRLCQNALLVRTVKTSYPYIKAESQEVT